MNHEMRGKKEKKTTTETNSIVRHEGREWWGCEGELGHVGDNEGPYKDCGAGNAQQRMNLNHILVRKFTGFVSY